MIWEVISGLCLMTVTISLVELEVRAASCPHLVGHDRESPSLFPGAGRLDGRVEGQQIGLIRDAADGGDDGFDAPGLLVELLYLFADRIDRGVDVRGGVEHPVDDLPPLAALATVSLAMARLLGRFPGGDGFLHPLGDVARQLDDFDHLALVVEDGVVGGLSHIFSPVTQTHENRT